MQDKRLVFFHLAGEKGKKPNLESSAPKSQDQHTLDSLYFIFFSFFLFMNTHNCTD